MKSVNLYNITLKKTPVQTTTVPVTGISLKIAAATIEDAIAIAKEVEGGEITMVQASGFILMAGEDPNANKVS